jgi:hypothetical protein
MSLLGIYKLSGRVNYGKRSVHPFSQAFNAGLEHNDIELRFLDGWGNGSWEQ